MRSSVVALLIGAIIQSALASFVQTPAPLRLKAGDLVHVEVTVYTEKEKNLNTGDYLVARDGYVYGRTFGKVLAAGRTVDAVERDVRKALKPFVNEEEVFVSLKAQTELFVFLLVTEMEESAAQDTKRGPLPYTGGLTLRQVLSATSVKDSSLWSVRLTRGGREILSQPLSSEKDVAVQPNDLIVVSPSESQRVWVSGLVRMPGRYRLDKSATLNVAVAAAGGLVLEAGRTATEFEDLKATIRREGKDIEVRLGSDGTVPPTPVQEGDQIILGSVPATRYSVLGEVLRPGEFSARGEISVYRALANAGGPNVEGALSQVLVYREGELYSLDLSAPERGKGAIEFKLKSGDLVYVQRNEKAFYVMGQVMRPGRFLMTSDREYRLIDALSLAGGLLPPEGTLRRVYLARPAAGGKYQVSMYNLDEFTKDGKIAANPIIRPGDAIFFSPRAGITIANVTNFITPFVLLRSLIR